MAKIKVLLVEDDEGLVEIYQLKFKEEGWEVFHLFNGNEVLELAKKEKPEIILLDIMLPGMDGFAILKELKINPVTKNVPVILLSNLGQESDVQKGRELGATDYLVKAEYTPSQVVDKVKSILK